jgi:hypothetical protein
MKSMITTDEDIGMAEQTSARHRVDRWSVVTCLLLVPLASGADPEWVAGDHHIHSLHSSDGFYPVEQNARMALQHGLDWIVTTDHGGPRQSHLRILQAYPDLIAARKAIPDLIQFYGMELDSPGADHSSIIVPHTANEANVIFAIESSFSKNDPVPKDPLRDKPEHMIAALKFMGALRDKPVLIANHASRKNKIVNGKVVYGLDDPAELRLWNDTAPEVAVGMEGAPGHQARGLRNLPRGSYSLQPTYGGFDRLAAKRGGFWDSMLAEGRHWWITATSDSHRHITDPPGSDFWPGEYSKTYVWAEREYEAILQGLRRGNVFVTTGDLISELYVTAEVAGSGNAVGIGETLTIPAGATVDVTVRFLDPSTTNSNGDSPQVSRVDIITGTVTGPLPPDKMATDSASTKVAESFTAARWTSAGKYRTATWSWKNVTADAYLRVRGTNGTEMEPLADVLGEDPWQDLWFYSNPIFLQLAERDHR